MPRRHRFDDRSRRLIRIEPPWRQAQRLFHQSCDTRIGEVIVGGEVTVKTASGAETYTGTVSFVSDAAEFTPNTIDTPDQRAKLVFAVRIRVDDPTGALKPGMPVDVRLP